jgi:hypothetical protein
LHQHLSTSFFASLQNIFPFFCCSQQHVFTSLPVSVQVIFGEAADAIVATVNAVSSGSHFVITFINHLLFVSSSLYTLESCPRSNAFYKVLRHLLRSFAMTMIRATIKRIPSVIQTHIGQPKITIHHLFSVRARTRRKAAIASSVSNTPMVSPSAQMLAG